MRVGYARADITPPIGVTLSGFAARCDKPLLGKGNFCCYSGRCKCDKADADCALVRSATLSIPGRKYNAENDCFLGDA